MDLYYQGEIIIWSTQFNPGGIFYKKIHEGERRPKNSGVIVSKLFLTVVSREGLTDFSML